MNCAEFFVISELISYFGNQNTFPTHRIASRLLKTKIIILPLSAFFYRLLSSHVTMKKFETKRIAILKGI